MKILKSLKNWKKWPGLFLRSLVCFPAQVWAQDQGVKVGKCQEDLGRTLFNGEVVEAQLQLAF